MNNEEEKSGRRNQEKSGKRNEEKRDDKKVEHITLDNPDMLNTENGSLFDKDEQMRFYDAVPVEELNDKVRDEDGDFKGDQKSTSASERKFKKDK